MKGQSATIPRASSKPSSIIGANDDIGAFVTSPILANIMSRKDSNIKSDAVENDPGFFSEVVSAANMTASKPKNRGGSTKKQNAGTTAGGKNLIHTINSA